MSFLSDQQLEVFNTAGEVWLEFYNSLQSCEDRERFIKALRQETEPSADHLMVSYGKINDGFQERVDLSEID
ncbi:MAG: hypothetical protein AAF226_00400 [Verrucomicrobiota bacterium]